MEMPSFNFEDSVGEREFLAQLERLRKSTEKKIDKLVQESKKRQTFKLELDEKKLQNDAEVRHKQFDTVALAVRNRLPVFLYGDSGAGKSKIAEQVAEMLNLPYYAISVSYQTSVGTLLGYMDAQGHYVRSLLRDAFENGGVFCIDEIDAGNQNVIMCLNAITNQDTVGFPDGMVKKHKDFIPIATANTRGDGSDLQYSGRERIDAALLARFLRVKIDYDLGLERKLIEKSQYVDEIMAFITDKRKRTELDTNVLWTPRQTVFMAKLAADVGFENAKKIISEEGE